MASTTGSINLSAKTVGPASDLAIGNSGRFTATTTLTVSGADTLSVGNSNAFTAGLLGNSPPAMGSGLLLATNIVKKGSITFTGNGATGVNGVSIGNSNIFTNNGAKLSITVKTGDLQFGDSNQFIDRGGNLVILAFGNLTGGTGNQFKAQGVVNTSTGGIELGAGTTVSGIASDFSKTAGTRTGTANISGFTDLSPTHGAIVLNPSSALTVNLATGGPNSTISTLLGGPVRFNAVNGAQVQLQGSGTFQTEASKPISFNDRFQGEAEIIVDTGDDAANFEDDADIVVNNRSSAYLRR